MGAKSLEWCDSVTGHRTLYLKQMQFELLSGCDRCMFEACRVIPKQSPLQVIFIYSFLTKEMVSMEMGVKWLRKVMSVGETEILTDIEDGI
jgi:hypothetical protein